MQRIFNKIQEIKTASNDAVLVSFLPDENIQAWGSWLRFATPTSIHRQKRSWLSLRYAYFCLMKIFRRCEVGLDKLGLLPFIGRKEVGFALLRLLLPDENIHRHSVEVPLGADFIFQEALIRLFYILWQVRKEEERRNACLVQLHTVFDLDILTLD